MSGFKMKGFELFDSRHTKIGYVKDSNIFDARHSKKGYVKGTEIYDARHTKMAYLKGDDVYDAQHRRIARMVEIQKSITDALGGPSLVALWLFFVA